MAKFKKYLQKRLNQLTLLDRRDKAAVVFLFDTTSCLVATWLTYTLLYENFYEPRLVDLGIAGLALVLYLPFFVWFGLYTSIIRYSSLRTIMMAAKACVAYGALFFTAILILSIDGVPRSVGILQPLLFFFLISNGRLVVSQVLQSSLLSQQKRKKVLICGIAAAGVELSEVVFRSGEYRFFGFVDEQPPRVGRSINGKTVPPASELEQFVETNNIRKVMLAIPNAQTQLHPRAINELAGMTVRVRSVPSLGDLVQGTADISQLRDLDIKDPIDSDPISAIDITPGIQGKLVLVTGAAGSIGSELCRQIIAFEPSKLVLLDHREVGLYTIQRQLKSIEPTRNLDVELHCQLATVRESAR